MSRYIDLDAAANGLAKIINESDMPEDWNKGMSAAMSALFRIPAADVRPVVKAHWYWDKDGMDWNIGAWRCSACKAMSPMWWNCDKGSPMHKSGHYFCPNCGADMREES